MASSKGNASTSTSVKVHNGLLPTPPMPKGLPQANLTENARKVLMKRYVRRGDDGQPAETVEEMFWRVAYHVAKVEEQWDGDVQKRTVEYYHLLSSKKFFPNSPTFTGAGTPLGQLAACFTGSMRITTDQGAKRIDQLQVGDRVLTHLGHYRPVTHLFQRAYDDELLNIKIKLIGTTLEVTPEHPILTQHGWIKAGELHVGDKVAIGGAKGSWVAPVFDLAATEYADELELQTNESFVRVRRPSIYQNSGRQAEWVNRFIELTPELARLCGYYVSEGSIGPGERYVRFTFAKDEIEYHQDVINLIESIFGAPVNCSDSTFGNWMNINVYSRPIVSWFCEHFSKGSTKKRIPAWLQFAECEIQESFLIGVMRGDGLYFERTYVTSSYPFPKVFRALRLTLSNPALVQQIWQMCLRLGYDAGIHPVDTTYVTPNASPAEQISMPPLQSRELVKKAFGVELQEPNLKYVRNKVFRDAEGQVYFEIESITHQSFNGVVYNCEVDEDHTYVTEGVVVHNCFVLPITDDMGRDSAGIFQTLRDAALIQQTGGGNGFSFSRLRPKGALVQTSAGQATGPVGFLRVYDHAFGEIAQGGCLLPETLVFTSKGLLRLDEIVNSDESGWQEHTLSVPTDEGLKESPRGYNNGVADVFRVHTRQGLSITGTPNHKVKVMTDAGPQWKEIQHLARGDWILVRLGEHTGKLQALKKPAKKHGNQVMSELPSLLDEEFAFFLGYLAGDGFVAQGEEDRRVGVSVAHSSYLTEEMPALMERLFNVNVHKMQKPNDRSSTFVMDNRAIKEFLLMNGLGKRTSRDVSVPRLIRQSPSNVVGAYLRGLFEADGALSHGYPSLMTTSPELAREVATLLIGLGCPVGIRTISPGLDHWGDAQTYQVRITSTVGLQSWREKIGCDQRSRFVAAHAWESDLRRETTYVLPNAKYWLQPVMEAITLEQIDKKGRGRNINFRATAPRLRRQILRYYREDRNLTRSGYDLLKAEHPEAFEYGPSVEGFWFVEVGGVEAAGKSLTLDLEVADNHTYLAYGIVTHNTRRGANMAVLRVDHPDVEDFVTSKTNENHITNFNISVGITDAFMRAVKEDGEWELRFPDIAEMKRRRFSGTLEQAEKEGITIRGYKKVKARELFKKIVKQAHHNGEPGVLFLDASNRSNPVPHLYPLEATNPCATGDTLVATPTGWKRADTIQEGDEICTVLGVGRVAAVEVNENMPVYDLHLSDGAVVRVTASHQFHVRDSRRKFFEPRRLDELQRGDWVRVYRAAIPNNEVPGKPESVTDREYGFLVGVLVGDGCYTPRALSKNVVRISTHADEYNWNAVLSDAFAKVGVEEMYTYVNKGSRSMMMDPKPGRVVANFVRSLPLEPARGPEKSLPDAYINSNREFLEGLLDGLFSTDGSVDLQSNHPLVRFHTSSPELAKQLRRILLMFGIYGRISKTQRMAHDIDGRALRNDRPKYDVVISGESFGRFFEQIRLSHPTKQMRMEEAALKTNFTGGNWAAKVVKIEPAGVETVYDLYEPKSDTWITEGFVSRGCGEQWLGPYENCCLGSVNLNEHCGPEGTVDWELLRESVVMATRFLDDVVESNAYVPAVPQLQEAAHRARRIGLGIMGLADLMYHVGVRYGSKEGQEFGAQIMEFVRYHAMQTSVQLAQERGPFPAIEGSIYDMDNMTWTPPQSLISMNHDWGRPDIQWDSIVKGIREHGIRNAAQTTVAPTGTIATVAGCEGYGCEPVFALAYYRHVNDNGNDLKLTYASPRFDEALKKLGLGEEKRQEIVEQVMRDGTCQQIKGIPQSVRDTFVVSADITAEEHVRMQAVLQAFVDNSLSKCVTGDTLVLTANGLMPISTMSDMRLPDQFESHDVNIVSPTGIERSDSFYYGGMRETRHVTLAHGFEIEGTPNHRVQVLQADGRVEFKMLNDLKIGDEVLIYMGQQVFGPESQPLPAFTGAFRTVAKNVRFPSHMSAELAHLLGCITSEGSIGENSIQICNGNRALLEGLGGSFEKLFGLNSHIVQDLRRDSVYSLQVNSRPLRNWLLNDLGLEAGARNKIIPDCVLRAGRREIAAFLRGLFLDAYMTLNGRMFGISLASRRLLRQLQTLLLNFGVFSMIHRSAEHAWVLNVSGEALDLLAAFVEFDEVWKNERIEIRNEGRVHLKHNYATLLPETVTTNLREMQENAPESLRSLFHELPKSHGIHEPEYQRARVNLLHSHRLERALARQIYDHFKDYATPFAQQFFSIDQPGVLYVKVKRIEAGFNEVFDISVPGSHSFIANGIGNHNTVNFHETATEDDVAQAYMLAWELGCKGITVYVTGSREKVVLETKATAEKKDASLAPTLSATETKKPEISATFPMETKKPRPRALHGKTYSVETPVGKAFITINENGGDQPFEAFINTAKAGSETAAVSEAIGRLISYVLRLTSPTKQTDRLREIIRQLSGIGGGRSLGLGPNRVRSLPDGIGQVLDMYLRERAGALPLIEEKQNSNGNGGTGHKIEEEVEAQMTLQPLKIGDLCPECGEAAVVNEEGCRKCYACGYSEC